MMRKWGIVFLALFFVLMGLEFRGFFVGIDPMTTRLLQKFIPRFFDVPLSFFSILGSAEITILILLGIFAFVFIKEKRIFFSLGLFLVLTGFELLGKFTLYHPGPPEYFFRYALPFTTPSYVSTPYSFPSGHVSRTMFIAVVLVFLVGQLVTDRWSRRLVSFGLAVAALLMMVSRVYLGEHWVSDVLGGAFLGSAVGVFAMVYY